MQMCRSHLLGGPLFNPNSQTQAVIYVSNIDVNGVSFQIWTKLIDSFKASRAAYRTGFKTK